MMAEWARLKTRNKRAKLVCIDIQPSGTTQGARRDDVRNSGGFWDAVFDQIADFGAGRMGSGRSRRSRYKTGPGRRAGATPGKCWWNYSNLPVAGSNPALPQRVAQVVEQ